MATTYERLADRMLGNVTVRMSRIRLVTAIAVGAAVAERWSDGEIANDGVSAPDIIFEWLTIMAFVRHGRGEVRDHLRGVGGMQKVERSLRAGSPVSAKTYLKTPRVFGFGGVFRRFAEGSGVLDREGRLEDAGRSLVRAWERDQGLSGFLDGMPGSKGGEFLEALRKAVGTGISKGFVAASHVPSKLSEQIFAHLNPDGLMDRHLRNGNEQRLLRDLVRSGAASTNRSGRPDQRECSEFLFDCIKAHGRQLSQPEEADFLRACSSTAPIALREVLDEIDAYESLCRPLRDTIDWIRWSMGTRATPLDRTDFLQATQSAGYLAALHIGVLRVQSTERLYTQHPDVKALLERFGEVRGAGDLFDAVIDHHHIVQREKPPSGKRPWVEPVGKSGRYLVRPSYVLDEAPPVRPHTAPAPYVHEYRIRTLTRFLRDLGEID